MSVFFAPRFFAPEVRSVLREPFFLRYGRFVAERDGHRSPAVDLEETASGYSLSAEVPGYTRDDLSIEFKEDEQLLVISGKRAEPAAAAAAATEAIDVDKELATQLSKEETNTWLNERSCRRGFQRSFRLPEHVDVDHVKAHLANGLLKLELPKAAKPDPVKVTIE